MLKIEKINIGYSNYLLSKDFSINIKTPQLIAITGNNGVGKSTLIKTIAGIIPPKKGKICIENYDITKLSFYEKAKKISIVLTHFPENLSLTVNELLINTALITKQHNFHKNLEKAINFTQIQKLLHKKFATLSDGQKQKVMIARALVQNTPILLLDEPFVHLDYRNKKLILNFLNQLKKEKIIIFSSHDYLAIINADCIWNMENKQINAITSQQFVIKSKAIKEIYNFYIAAGVKKK